MDEKRIEEKAEQLLHYLCLILVIFAFLYNFYNWVVHVLDKNFVFMIYDTIVILVLAILLLYNFANQLGRDVKWI